MSGGVRPVLQFMIGAGIAKRERERERAVVAAVATVQERWWMLVVVGEVQKIRRSCTDGRVGRRCSSVERRCANQDGGAMRS